MIGRRCAVAVRIFLFRLRHLLLQLPCRPMLVIFFVLFFAFLFLVTARTAAAATTRRMNFLFLCDAYTTIPILIGVWWYLNANAHPTHESRKLLLQQNRQPNREKPNTYQWYHASQPSQPIIGVPSSTRPQAGQIQT